MFGAYGNFMNDPTAQIGVQLGQNAFKAGQEYLEHNACLPHPEEVIGLFAANQVIGEPMGQLLRAQTLL
jgi:hypothetical protein